MPLVQIIPNLFPHLGGKIEMGALLHDGVDSAYASRLLNSFLTRGAIDRP